MKLFFNRIGEGRPLIILHGLFGLGDNWATSARQLATHGFACYLVDQRNHGRSPHSPDFSYPLMSEDLFELLQDQRISQPILLGHSMGGKTVIRFALDHAGIAIKLVVVDIAPRYYPPHHQAVLAALHAVDFDQVRKRKEVEDMLRNALHEEATVQFLLKNLYWVSDDRLAWRFDLDTLSRSIDSVGDAMPNDRVIETPTLFVRGERSGYITAGDEVEISRHFSTASVVTVPAAGHWVHAENPKGFLEAVLPFLNS